MTEGLSRRGFDLDLLDGKAAEGALLRLLFEPTFEVKMDEVARRTGNVFIEFWQSGPPTNKRRPSGLQVTTADRFAIQFQPGCWLIQPTERLRRLAAVWEERHGLKRGGDHDLYEGVCIPIRRLLESEVGSNQTVSLRPVEESEGLSAECRSNLHASCIDLRGCPCPCGHGIVRSGVA